MAVPDKPMSLLPERGERALIVGQTGSGKTAFAVWMMKRLQRGPIVIYDTKIEAKFATLQPSVIVGDFDGIMDAFNKGENDYIIVRPPSELIGEPGVLDNEYLFRHYMELPGVDAYIDELKSFHNHGHAGKGLINLLERGRSKGTTVIMSTQRPSWISLSTLSEAQKTFIFYLKSQDDIKRVAKFVPGFEAKPKLASRGYQFYYYDDAEDKLTLFKPIKLDDPQTTSMVEAEAIAEPDADRKRGLIWS